MNLKIIEVKPHVRGSGDIILVGLAVFRPCPHNARNRPTFGMSLFSDIWDEFIIIYPKGGDFDS